MFYLFSEAIKYRKINLTPNVFLSSYLNYYWCCLYLSFNSLVVRLSFPSGHATGASFAGVFFALYVEYCMRPKHFLLLKPLVQCIAVFGGVAIALTRISDYFHHPTDVLTGLFIGTTFAFYTVSF